MMHFDYFHIKLCSTVSVHRRGLRLLFIFLAFQRFQTVNHVPKGRFTTRTVMLLPDPLCTSPDSAPWILDGRCMKIPIVAFPNPYSDLSDRTCGFCGSSASYLSHLRDSIETQFKEKCVEMVVYGAAFGSEYERWIKRYHHYTENRACTFYFIGSQADGFGGRNFTPIHVDLSRFPYRSHRRTVKLLKLNPSLLFPWAKRIIWQDAKLLRSTFYNPPDLVPYFRNTVEILGVCASFMSLPKHRSSVAKFENVTLLNHCATLLKASSKRPNLSDGLESLSLQCALYYGSHLHLDSMDPRRQIFLQEPMIDSALMLFDMQSETCRQFNPNLACTWLNEIHCHSDRDQVSFPTSLASSGVRLSPSIDSSFRIFEGADGQPLVGLIPSECHWYYPRKVGCSINFTDYINS